MYVHRYTVVYCPNCRADLTQDSAVSLHISVDGHNVETFSHLAKDGLLVDTRDRVVAKGFHAGTCCRNCNYDLSEYESAEPELVRASHEFDSPTHIMVGEGEDRVILADALPLKDGLHLQFDREKVRLEIAGKLFHMPFVDATDVIIRLQKK